MDFNNSHIVYGGEEIMKGYYIEDQQSDFISDTFHFIVNLSWILTLLLSMLLWVIIQFMFASLYLIDKDGIVGLDISQPFVSTFFLSIQTFSTVGYGVVFPNSRIACTVMIFEILVSVCFTSLFSGIIFYKFSKAASVIQLCDVICLAVTGLENPTLLLRFAHLEHRALLNMRLKLFFVEYAPESVEFKRRRILAQVVNLSDQIVPYFTVAHEFVYAIDQLSPLRKYLYHDDNTVQLRFKPNVLFFIFTLEGIGSVLKTTVQEHRTYSLDCIRFNHKFEPLIRVRVQEMGGPIIYINRLNKTIPIDDGSD